MANALGFNSTGDYLGRTSNLLDFNASYTVTLWAYFTSFSDYAHFWGATVDNIEQNGNYVNSDMMGHDNAGTANSRIAVCNSGSGGGQAFPTGAAFATGTWVFLGLRRTGDNLLELFINGSGTATASSTISVSTRGTVGGEWLGRLNGAYNINGRIANVKQWSAALTAGEIAAEKDFSDAIHTSNLHEVWKFPVGGSQLVGDINGYTWTANGTITDESGPPVDLGIEVSGTGAAELTGTSTINQDFTIAGTGSAIFSGSGTVEYSGNIEGSGSAKFTGSSTVSQDFTISGSGSIVLAGASTVNQDLVISGSTSGMVSGSGTVNQDITASGSLSAKWDSSSTVNQDFSYSGAGSAKIEGTGTVDDTDTSIEVTGAVSAKLDGSGSVVVTYTIDGSLSAKVGGTSSLSQDFTIAGTQGAKISGTSTVNRDFTISGALEAYADISSSIAVPYVISGSGSAYILGRYRSGNVSTNAKRLSIAYTTGETVYAIVKRLSDGYYLSNTDGSFAVSPADPYKSLTEDSILSGIYTITESRERWQDGSYFIAYYAAVGSPDPDVDTLIPNFQLEQYIRSDFFVKDGVISDRIMQTLLPIEMKSQKLLEAIYSDTSLNKKLDQIRVDIAEMKKSTAK